MPELTYDSKIISHSLSTLGNDIITYEITIPKWMVAELNTHKMEIERNSASSRAVPTVTILGMVRDEPCIPIWRYNEKGMSANEPLNAEDAAYAEKIWLEIRDYTIEKVKLLQQLPSGRSVAKGTANRPLEFVMWTKVVVTFTGGGGIGLNNFFGLRDTPQAQPEFGLVAHMMHEQYHNSVPVLRKWHTPYISDEEFKAKLQAGLSPITIAVISSAMCGRVTHYRQGQTYTDDENVMRGMDFAKNGHFSPLRHASNTGKNCWYGNFYGWKQVSKLLLTDDYVVKCCDRRNKKVWIRS